MHIFPCVFDQKRNFIIYYTPLLENYSTTQAIRLILPWTLASHTQCNNIKYQLQSTETVPLTITGQQPHLQLHTQPMTGHFAIPSGILIPPWNRLRKDPVETTEWEKLKED